MKNRHLRAVLIYHGVFIIFMAFAERGDKSGQGMIAIPGFVMLAMPVHYVFSVLRNFKEGWRVHLSNLFYIGGGNILFFFVDILAIILLLNLLQAFKF